MKVLALFNDSYHLGRMSTPTPTSAEPLHVQLSEPATDPKARRAERGRSVRLQGCLHDFSDLIGLYGSDFVERLLDAFTRAYVHSSASTTAKRSINLNRFLKHLARLAHSDEYQSTAVQRVQHQLAAGRHSDIEYVDMLDAVEAIVSRIRDRTDRSIIASNNVLTRKSVVESLSTTFKHLAVDKLWPEIPPLKSIVGMNLSGNNLPSFGEVRSGRSDAVTGNGPDEDGFHEEAGRSKTRLSIVRKLLEDELLDEQEKYRRGKQLIARGDLPPIDIIKCASQQIASYFLDRRSKQAAEVELCFPIDNRERRLACLLKYIVEAEGGIMDLKTWSFGLKQVLNTVGGMFGVLPYLEGQGRALLAAQTIVLIDTGMNIQPCKDLPTDPFVGEAKHGRIKLRTLSSIKNRAGYLPVAAVVPDDAGLLREEALTKVASSTVSTVEAIRIWQELSAPIRVRAAREGEGMERFLWIKSKGQGNRDNVRQPLDTAYKDWWGEFMARNAAHPEIGGLPLQRQMIRTTVLRIASADHNGDSELPRLLAQHRRASTTSRHYLRAAHLKTMLDQQIRTFQNRWESVALPNDADRSEKLGVSRERLTARRNEAVETGLGYMCADPLAGVQAGTNKGETCSRVDACANCSMLRFDPTPSALRGLVLFDVSLEKAEPEFASRNPERWIEAWLSARALARATIEKVQAGPRKRVLEEARKQVAEQLASGEMELFVPW